MGNFLKKIGPAVPVFLQLPYHVLSKKIEPLLSAGSLLDFHFFPGPKAVESN
jgi:hypothetical protein